MTDETIVLEVKWTVNDLKDALWDNGFIDTDENIKILIKNGRLPQVLKEMVLQQGKEIIEEIIKEYTDDLEIAVKEVETCS